MFSATSEYALRALSQLAQLPRGTAILGRDLARETNVPSNYLSKIMLSLRNAGMVGATRGNGGGYRLLRAPETLRLIEVLELFEDRAVPNCLLGQGVCSESKPCAAHASWREVRGRYVEFLEKTTVADLSHSVLAQGA